MDLEEFTRRSIRQGRSSEAVIQELTGLAGSAAKARAVYQEVINSENIPEGFLSRICETPAVGLSAGSSGLGCRGEGDFLIHRTIADIIGETGAVVDSVQQDDGGVIAAQGGFITAAVDGMHSRLSHFPFLAGFHAARAALRDVIVMGVPPLAMLSDIHIGDDGDVGRVLDYTAGASAVAELMNIPLIGGSTLRIGGDMVKGDRITGAIFAVGAGRKLTARRGATAGDVLVLTEGSGGGTIATTALYNGYPEVMLETLTVSTMEAAVKLIDSPLFEHINSATDITNGGIRGDAREFGATADVKVVIERREVHRLISPKVLQMLTELEIDPLGISTDSLLFTLPPEHAGRLIAFLAGNDVRSAVVGRIDQGRGVYINDGEDGSGSGDIETDGVAVLRARFREAPYTPVKKIVDEEVLDLVKLADALGETKRNLHMKKKEIVDWIRSRKDK